MIRLFARSFVTDRHAPRSKNALREAVRSCVETLEARQFLDALPPTAQVLSIPDITTAGGAFGNVVVRYDDETSLNAQSIDVSDITVTAPDGQTVLPVTSVSVVLDDSAGAQDAAAPVRLLATYNFDALGGTWDSGDTGTYAVTVVAGAVADLGANVSAAATGNVKVNIQPPSPPPPPPPPVDLLAPIGVITAPAAITTAGAPNASVTIVYTDDSGINPG